MEGISVKIESIIRRLNGDLKDDIFSNNLDAVTIRELAINLSQVCQTINSEEILIEMNHMKELTKNYEDKYNMAISELDKLENELEAAKRNSSHFSNISSIPSVNIEKKFASQESIGSSIENKENINPEEELYKFRRRLTNLERENQKLLETKEQVFTEIEEKFRKEQHLENKLTRVSCELNDLKEILKKEQENRYQIEVKASEMESEIIKEETRVRNLENQNELLKGNCQELLEHLTFVEEEMNNVLGYKEKMRKEYNERIIELERQLKVQKQREHNLLLSAEQFLSTPDHKISSSGKTINTQVRANLNSSIVKTTKKDKLPSIQTKSPIDFCYDNKEKIKPFNDRYNHEKAIEESADAFSSGLSLSRTYKEESIKNLLGELKLEEEMNQHRKSQVDQKLNSEKRKGCLSCNIY